MLLACLLLASPATAAEAGEPARPRLINPDRPPALLLRGQGQAVPRDCAALVASRRIEGTCDFAKGTPLFANEVEIPERVARDCPSPVEFEYADPQDGRTVRDYATQRRRAVQSCGAPIAAIKVR